MKTIRQVLPGVHLLEPTIVSDARGQFVKTFHPKLFAELGISFVPVEVFFSVSKKHVLRGMHFQIPPHDQAKLVYCAVGGVLDVILDLRKKSPSFGVSNSLELTEKNRRMLFIPSGFAHGFLALEDNSVMIYHTSTVHTPECDKGIHWDSFGFGWPVQCPISSERDIAFPRFADFNSPF